MTPAAKEFYRDNLGEIQDTYRAMRSLVAKRIGLEVPGSWFDDTLADRVLAGFDDAFEAFKDKVLEDG